MEVAYSGWLIYCASELASDSFYLTKIRISLINGGLRLREEAAGIWGVDRHAFHFVCGVGEWRNKRKSMRVKQYYNREIFLWSECMI